MTSAYCALFIAAIAIIEHREWTLSMTLRHPPASCRLPIHVQALMRRSVPVSNTALSLSAWMDRVKEGEQCILSSPVGAKDLSPLHIIQY